MSSEKATSPTTAPRAQASSLKTMGWGTDFFKRGTNRGVGSRASHPQLRKNSEGIGASSPPEARAKGGPRDLGSLHGVSFPVRGPDEMETEMKMEEEQWQVQQDMPEACQRLKARSRRAIGFDASRTPEEQLQADHLKEKPEAAQGAAQLRAKKETVEAQSDAHLLQLEHKLQKDWSASEQTALAIAEKRAFEAEEAVSTHIAVIRQLNEALSEVSAGLAEAQSREAAASRRAQQVEQDAHKARQELTQVRDVAVAQRLRADVAAATAEAAARQTQEAVAAERGRQEESAKARQELQQAREEAVAQRRRADVLAAAAAAAETRAENAALRTPKALQRAQMTAKQHSDARGLAASTLQKQSAGAAGHPADSRQRSSADGLSDRIAEMQVFGEKQGEDLIEKEVRGKLLMMSPHVEVFENIRAPRGSADSAGSTPAAKKGESSRERVAKNSNEKMGANVASRSQAASVRFEPLGLPGCLLPVLMDASALVAQTEDKVKQLQSVLAGILEADDGAKPEKHDTITRLILLSAVLGLTVLMDSSRVVKSDRKGRARPVERSEFAPSTPNKSFTRRKLAFENRANGQLAPEEEPSTEDADDAKLSQALPLTGAGIIRAAERGRHAAEPPPGSWTAANDATGTLMDVQEDPVAAVTAALQISLQGKVAEAVEAAMWTVSTWVQEEVAATSSELKSPWGREPTVPPCPVPPLKVAARSDDALSPREQERAMPPCAARPVNSSPDSKPPSAVSEPTWAWAPQQKPKLKPAPTPEPIPKPSLTLGPEHRPVPKLELEAEERPRPEAVLTMSPRPNMTEVSAISAMDASSLISTPPSAPNWHVVSQAHEPAPKRKPDLDPDPNPEPETKRKPDLDPEPEPDPEPNPVSTPPSVAKKIRSWEDRLAGTTEDPRPNEHETRSSMVNFTDMNLHLPLASSSSPVSTVSPVLAVMNSGYSGMMDSAHWAVSTFITAMDGSEEYPYRLKNKPRAALMRSSSDGDSMPRAPMASPLERRASMKLPKSKGPAAAAKNCRVHWSTAEPHVIILKESSWSEWKAYPDNEIEYSTPTKAMTQLIEDVDRYFFEMTGL
ncbi:hypothetical protein CYMTET_53773 [Cymbomonas tetramitiformis]|uniref:Uncharacterized protein n=1 Tax=Cymbomonas tetramitiformis TaxID=36881 RepID=A0AAE0BGJ3_9CHLO|nr:hypothetical protein CYMTET_53773 [Cymbomonas tetramitiformis]